MIKEIKIKENFEFEKKNDYICPNCNTTYFKPNKEFCIKEIKKGKDKILCKGKLKKKRQSIYLQNPLQIEIDEVTGKWYIPKTGFMGSQQLASEWYDKHLKEKPDFPKEYDEVTQAVWDLTEYISKKLGGN